MFYSILAVLFLIKLFKKSVYLAPKYLFSFSTIINEYGFTQTRIDFFIYAYWYKLLKHSTD